LGGACWKKQKFIFMVLTKFHEKTLNRIAMCFAKLCNTNFQQPANWETFNLSELGSNIFSYTESLFDGKYVYYGSERNDEGAHCFLLRFNTKQNFKSSCSWEIFDAAQVVGRHGSYVGIAYDGRFIYYAPFRAGVKLEVENFSAALRYDTLLPFREARSWKLFDLSRIHPEASGYVGAKYADGAVYFCPYYSGSKSIFVKLNVVQPFDQIFSWEWVDLSQISPLYKGYMGVEYDGRYIYFSPCLNDNTLTTNTHMLRLDSKKSFCDPSSWEIFNLAESKGNPFLGGYHGSMAFDGRYIYYSPLYAPLPCDIQTMHHGYLVRFDTTRSFQELESWEVFNTRSLHPDICGFSGIGFDGDYIYYCPVRCCSHSLHGKMLRYNTHGPFTDASSYEVYDAEQLDPDLVYFDGQIAFDGVHIYYPAASGKRTMLRFRAKNALFTGFYAHFRKFL
jgi:hypothetical protein